MLRAMFSAVAQATAWLLFRALLGLWLLASGGIVLGLHVIALMLLGEKPESFSKEAEFRAQHVAFYALALCVLWNWLRLCGRAAHAPLSLIFAPAVLIILSILAPFGAAFCVHAVWQIAPERLLTAFVLGSLLGSLISHIAIGNFLSVRCHSGAPPRGRPIAVIFGE